MNIDFSYYLSVFLRRFHYFIVIALLCTVAGFTVAFTLPPKYSAEARLLVETSQIPQGLASSTVQTVLNEQLQVIEQRLMSRSNLVEVANRLEIFPPEEELSANAIVGAMRSRVSFRLEGGRDKATFFYVGFSGDDPNQVAVVANEFVTMVLEENVRIRTNIAGETMQFFQDDVERLSVELDAQSSRILKFKAENSPALPENRDYLAGSQQNLTDSLRRSREEIDDLKNRKQNAIDLFEATGSLSNSATLSPEQRELQRLENELENALLVYASDNPKVRLLKAQVARMRDRVTSSLQNASDEDAASTGAQAVLDAQLREYDQNIADLQSAIVAMEDELAETESYLKAIPSNSVTLEGLNRDYQSIQSQYLQALQRRAAAETGERIELLSKGQRITVVEQATRPAGPVSPNRTMIAAAGAGAGISLGLGLVALLELLNRSIRRPIEISDKLGIAPFGVIPYIRTEQETRWRRFVLLGVVLFIVIGVPLIVWLFHLEIFALDEFAEGIANQFGLSLALPESSE